MERRLKKSPHRQLVGQVQQTDRRLDQLLEAVEGVQPAQGHIRQQFPDTSLLLFRTHQGIQRTNVFIHSHGHGRGWGNQRLGRLRTRVPWTFVDLQGKLMKDK
jgi:hypothetical protein